MKDYLDKISFDIVYINIYRRNEIFDFVVFVVFNIVCWVWLKFLCMIIFLVNLIDLWWCKIYVYFENLKWLCNLKVCIYMYSFFINILV